MKKIILILSMFLTMSMSASVFVAGTDDPVPWPFANRCPFPWSDITGLWKAHGSKLAAADTFEFNIVSVTESGARIIEINRYDSEMNIIASGRGVSPVGQNIVRLAMYTLSGTSTPRSYTAYVANYVERDKISCDQDRVHTVVTIRSYVLEDTFDSHYVVEKISKNQEQETSRAP